MNVLLEMHVFHAFGLILVFSYMLHVGLHVLVVDSCPLLCRNNSVESTAGLDFELGVFVRALMCPVWENSSVPGVYDLSALFKVREESSYKLLSVKDCGFSKTLAIHLGIGGYLNLVYSMLPVASSIVILFAVLLVR